MRTTIALWQALLISVGYFAKLESLLDKPSPRKLNALTCKVTTAPQPCKVLAYKISKVVSINFCPVTRYQ